jgi:hypothetical protein
VILNTALALIRFVLDAEENWCFSRIGTHCLENFFGLVRRGSLGDDRAVVARRIIAKTHLVASVMHDLDLAVTHRGRDNVGGTVIRGSKPEFVEDGAERLFRSLIHVSALDFDANDGADLITMDDLELLLTEWLDNDHHEKDAAYLARFAGKPANARISARMMQLAIGEGE